MANDRGFARLIETVQETAIAMGVAGVHNRFEYWDERRAGQQAREDDLLKLVNGESQGTLPTKRF